MKDATLIGPGIYPDMKAEDYHKLPYLSASRLATLRSSSLLHVRWEMDNPTEPTPAMQLGTAIHAEILEPDPDNGARGTVWVESPLDSYQSKEAKAWRDDVLAKGLIPLKSAEAALVTGAACEVWEHPAANVLLRQRTETELSIVWDEHVGFDGEAPTYTTCKARIDALAVIGGEVVILDLKTTQDASPAAFTKTIFDRRYHAQMEWYRRGLKAHGVEVVGAVIIAVETSAPCAVGVYRLKDEAIDKAAGENDADARRWAEAEQTGVWGGYGDQIQDIGLPEWAMKR